MRLFETITGRTIGIAFSKPTTIKIHCIWITIPSRLKFSTVVINFTLLRWPKVKIIKAFTGCPSIITFPLPKANFCVTRSTIKGNALVQVRQQK